MTRIVVILFLLTAAAIASQGVPRGDTYALIVSGIGKEAEDLAARRRVVNDLRAYLADKAFVRPDRLVVLTTDANSPAAPTVEEIRRTVVRFASTARPADRFLLYYIGQANAVGDTLRFNLPGPDITQEDWARWLASIQAGTQLVVFDCPCAALAARALTKPGRVLVFGSTEQQAHAPRFGLHFVPAVRRMESDADHDGNVSVLEAFTVAAREIEQWYQQRQLLPTETPCLEDNGDGQPSERPWRYEQDGGDGRLAARLLLTQEL